IASSISATPPAPASRDGTAVVRRRAASDPDGSRGIGRRTLYIGLLFVGRLAFFYLLANGPEEVRGSEDGQSRVLLAKALPFGGAFGHEVEQVIVPGDEVVSPGCQGKVHVGLVIRITGVGEDQRDWIEECRGTLQLLKKSFHSLWREGFEPPKD